MNALYRVTTCLGGKKNKKNTVFRDYVLTGGVSTLNSLNRVLGRMTMCSRQCLDPRSSLQRTHHPLAEQGTAVAHKSSLMWVTKTKRQQTKVNKCAICWWNKKYTEHIYKYTLYKIYDTYVTSAYQSHQ